MRAITTGLFIGNVIGFIASLIGQFTAGITLLGWVAVVAYLLLALGFGYFLLKPAGMSTT